MSTTIDLQRRFISITTQEPVGKWVMVSSRNKSDADAVNGAFSDMDAELLGHSSTEYRVVEVEHKVVSVYTRQVVAKAPVDDDDWSKRPGD